jgi:hypothetical protein
MSPVESVCGCQVIEVLAIGKSHLKARSDKLVYNSSV